MSKSIKIALATVAVLFALLAMVVAFIALRFDPNTFKPAIIRLVQEKKQRTLSIPGDIKLSYFPRLGVDLGKLSLSEHQSSAEFASVEHANVSLALLPLLKKQFVIDRVRIDGMRLQLSRRRDGATNLDDLLAKDEKSDEQIRFDIDGIDIRNASVKLDDRQQNRKIELTELNLDTGRIAEGVASKLALSTRLTSTQPRADARITLKTGFSFHLAKGQYAIKNMDADVNGRLLDFSNARIQLSGNADLKPGDKRLALDGIKLKANAKRAAQTLEANIDAPSLAVTDNKVKGGKLKAQASLRDSGRNLTLQFAVPSFDGSPQAFNLPSVALDAALQQEKLEVKANASGSFKGNLDKMLLSAPQLTVAIDGKQGNTALKGTLTTPLAVDMQSWSVTMNDIAAALSLPNPAGGSMKLQAGGSSRLDLGKGAASAKLNGNLDESRFDANFSINRFSPLAATFAVSVDRIDADRYRIPTAAGTSNTNAATQAADKPLDLSALQGMQLDGSVKIASLKFNNIKAANVRADIDVARGKLMVQPLSASLYGGTAGGSLSATTTAAPRIALRQNLAGINVGSLLKDAIDKKPIDGSGNVTLDITTNGGSFAQIKKSLDGSARLELRDGSIYGINIAQSIRKAKAAIGELRSGTVPQSGTASVVEKTDFSEMSGSFKIAGGVAHNDDLNIKSPLMRINGSGDINLGDERLDYVARATVVSTLQGQGGPELQALKGLTVPVRLSGPFSAIGWRIDFEGMAREAARQKIDEKKEEVRGKAQKALEEEKAKLRDQMKERFKGLLGK